MSLTQNNTNSEHIHMNTNIGSIWHEDQCLFFQTDPCGPKAREEGICLVRHWLTSSVHAQFYFAHVHHLLGPAARSVTTACCARGL